MPLFISLLVLLLVQPVRPQPQSSSDWIILDTPTSSRIKWATLFGDSLGYIVAEDQSIFRFHNGRWQQITLPPHFSSKDLFVPWPNRIFLTGRFIGNYDLALLEYRDGEWIDSRAPMLNQMRDTYFFDAESGWACGNKGELLRYKNGRWTHVYSPTRLNIIDLFADVGGNLYAAAAYSSYRGQMLHCKNDRWEVVPMAANLPGLSEGFAFPSDGIFLTAGPEWLFHWDGRQLRRYGLNMRRFQITDGLVKSGRGYLRLGEHVLFFDGTKYHNENVQLIPESGDIVASDTTAVWAYDQRGKLFSKGLKLSSQPAFTHHIVRRDFHLLGQMQGAAFMELEPDRPMLFLVDHEGTNVLAGFSEDRFPRLAYHNLYPAANFGLDEPQKGWLKRSIYDYAVLAADFDNDGREDLLLGAFFEEVRLFCNLGNGTFTDATEWAGLARHFSRNGIPATADIDNDGDLDLFIPDEIGPSRLLLNDGYGRFSPAPDNGGIALEQGGKGAAFADIDSDGWIDLAVTTYGEGSFVFRNQGDGRFAGISHLSPALQPERFEKCESLTFADYDNDGDFDLYICKLGTSNVLLQNDGHGRFRDVTAEAGLADSALSYGALFFDANNDGDLDLFVGNKGGDFFFASQGDGTFAAAHHEVRQNMHHWVPQLNAANAAGGYSTGAIVFDSDADGNLELLVMSHDAASYLYYAAERNSHFVALRPSGRRANRSSIGAVATLYPAGRLGDSSAVLGARMIDSVTGYGSHSQKLLHFGVTPGQRYDLELRFPGGATVHQRNLAPGSYLTVAEHGSGGDWATGLGHRTALLAMGFRAEERGVQMLLLLTLFIGIVIVVRRYPWWQGVLDVTGLAVVMALALLVAHVVIAYQHAVSYVVLPLLVAGGVGVAFVLALRWIRLYRSAEASLESLSLKLSGLGHSTALANLLSSLHLQLSQLPAESEIEAEQARRFLERSRLVRRQIGAEVQVIVGYQYAISFATDRAAKLLRTWRRLSRYLRRLEQRVVQNRTPKAGVLAQTAADLLSLREQLRQLRHQVRRHESCDAGEVIEQAISVFRDADLEFGYQRPDFAVPAHIPAQDLGTILTELFTNARRAMVTGRPRRIGIEVTLGAQVVIDVTDSGCGIPAGQQEQVFERSFSTRDAGGFGLYHARQTLARYNGRIAVQASDPDTGTTIRMLLQSGERATPSSIDRLKKNK